MRGDMRLDPREGIDLLRPTIPNDSKCGSLGGEFADEYSPFRSALLREPINDKLERTFAMSIDQKIRYFWMPAERGNFVAVKFTTPSAEKVEATFATPSTTDNVDTELLNYLKGMSVGDAIEINLKDSGLKTERSLKVRIGKHAKLANRELENRAVDGGFIFRVTAIVEPQATTANGTNGTQATTEATPEEASTARNRR